MAEGSARQLVNTFLTYQGVKMSGIDTLKAELNQLKSYTATIEKKLSSLEEMVKKELSVGRLADVEQIALGAAMLSGVALKSKNYKLPEYYPDVVHGHSLLMQKIIADFGSGITRPAANNVHIIEIGTTREYYWNQSSTSRLAALARGLGLQMVTVDMDSLNSESVAVHCKDYIKSVDAVTSLGERYLEGWQGELPPYIYLDAYDYDHGKHSQVRNERYEDIQGLPINDPDCWRMHYECAVHLEKKMPKNGVLVFDDVFCVDGEWLGKGVTAVPYLLDAGFKILSRTDSTLLMQKPGILG